MPESRVSPPGSALVEKLIAEMRTQVKYAQARTATSEQFFAHKIDDWANRLEALAALSGAEIARLQDLMRQQTDLNTKAINDAIAAEAECARLRHRECTPTEHAPWEGRSHGNCIVCNETWPCETSTRESLAHQETRSALVPCANCGHSDPHDGPAGDVADACTHPLCSCGFYVPARAPGSTLVEKLIAKWREAAWTSNEEGRQINRTVKGITDAEERCYARAQVWVKCADELEALAALSGAEIAQLKEERDALRIEALQQQERLVKLGGLLEALSFWPSPNADQNLARDCGRLLQGKTPERSTGLEEEYRLFGGPVLPMKMRAEAAEAELARLRQLCAEVYQVAGTLGAEARVLDNLRAAADGQPLPRASLLPYPTR